MKFFVEVFVNRIAAAVPLQRQKKSGEKVARMFNPKKRKKDDETEWKIWLANAGECVEHHIECYRGGFLHKLVRCPLARVLRRTQGRNCDGGREVIAAEGGR